MYAQFQTVQVFQGGQCFGVMRLDETVEMKHFDMGNPEERMTIKREGAMPVEAYSEVFIQTRTKLIHFLQNGAIIIRVRELNNHLVTVAQTLLNLYPVQRSRIIDQNLSFPFLAHSQTS